MAELRERELELNWCLLPVWVELTSGMGHRLILSVVFVGIIVGCSKKEETPSTSPTTSAKIETKASAIESPATNARGDSAAVGRVGSAEKAAVPATNAVKSAIAATNALAEKQTGAIGGIPETSSQTPAPVPTTTPVPAASGAATSSLAALSSDQVTQGIKEALGKGLQRAVATLGQPGGFLTNLNVKIPMPENLQLIEKGLRAINQGQYADQCITTMNQAAEQAVPAAADVFANSLKNMSVEDAKGILSGPQDGATQFFRKATETELTKKFSPIIQQAMTKCGTTAAYEQVLDKAKAVSPFFSKPSLDLNAYVTGKAMDGLFIMVAAEEKRIRENPVARSTDLLKSVFGALQK
jgi:hypothetical protein